MVSSVGLVGPVGLVDLVGLVGPVGPSPHIAEDQESEADNAHERMGCLDYGVLDRCVGRCGLSLASAEVLFVIQKLKFVHEELLGGKKVGEWVECGGWNAVGGWMKYKVYQEGGTVSVGWEEGRPCSRTRCSRIRSMKENHPSLESVLPPSV